MVGKYREALRRIKAFAMIHATVLDLSKLQLTELPPEIIQLTNSKSLYLSNNQLSELPPEIGQLTNLKDLLYGGNPLASPPPEIMKQGMKAVVDFLRERLEYGDRQWVSKLTVVGQGGVGKTSFLRHLCGEDFDPRENKTDGIAIRDVEVAHPEENDIIMTLRAWDFGGQDILHATHQFF